MNRRTLVTTRRLYRIESIAVVALALLSCANMFARQQDSTVEWKVTLQDLAHRLVGLASEDSAELESWRVDAEGLRTAIRSFAAEHPSMEIAVPGALPDKAGAQTLARQLDGLTSAVDQIIKQSPGSPFHLGTVNVVVSTEASTPSLVSDSIGHTEINQHNFLNIAKAFDYLAG